MKRRNAQRPSGFTLIELLVVMGLMALLTAMVFSNSFGMSQAASYAAAEETVYNVLQTARQRACIDGQDVYVVVVADKGRAGGQACLAIIEGSGLVSVGYQQGVHPDKGKAVSDGEAGVLKGCAGFIVDNGYSMQRPDKAEVDVYNLTSLGKAVLVDVRDEDKADLVPLVDVRGGARHVVRDAGLFDHSIRQLWIKPAEDAPFSAADWKAGTTYGFAILPPQRIPKGFVVSVDGGDTVCFYADGTSGVCDFKGGGGAGGHGVATVKVTESMARKNSRPIEFQVRQGNVEIKKSARR